ncbi:MAG: hypothetical protein M3R70_05310 [Actinomycetota bacterium]|nr:hypothetical protein [Actinomycetota bacterium]
MSRSSWNQLGSGLHGFKESTTVHGLGEFKDLKASLRGELREAASALPPGEPVETPKPEH